MTKPTRSPGFTMDQVRAFVVAADSGTLDVAASTLGLASPVSVVRSVTRLAKAIHRRSLMTTEGNRIVLTAEGTALLPHARAVLVAADAMGRAELPIRFSAYPSLAGQAAEAFAGRDVPFDFHDITERSRADGGAELIGRLRGGEVDIVAAPAGHEGEGLATRELYSWRMCAISADGLGGRVSPRDLDGRRVLVAPKGHRSRELVDQSFAQARVRLDVDTELTDPAILRSIALTSAGKVALIPNDSFGAPDRSLGAEFRTATGKATGGTYLLYFPEECDPDRSDLVGGRTAATAIAIRALLVAFARSRRT